MNIILVSECDKRALVQSRRILDQFAERRGERTWQTPITQAGLETLHRLLRASARKNTAVACHWVRGIDHTELLWIVGDRRRFNTQGAVPTHITRRNVLRAEDENDWHSGEDIRLLAQLAALLHDLGKASVAFQQRLRQPNPERNMYRHEWVSLRLFLAFVGADDDATWLARLAAPRAEDDASWTQAGRYWRDGLDAQAPLPFAHLPPLAAAVAWLVVTHHRLPTLPSYDEQNRQTWLGRRATTFGAAQLPNLLAGITHAWNEVLDKNASASAIAAYWELDAALPVTLPKWRAQASKIAARLQRLRTQAGKGEWLANPYVMHVARLTLMLADHHYSALEDPQQRVRSDAGHTLWANTRANRQPNQPLDEHLMGVARDAGRIAHGLPGFEQRLRHANPKALRKRSGAGPYQWQDTAADAAAALHEQAAAHGAFIVNMASTGCGKTLANARILHALARDPQTGLRATFALGLRTLTLQTGRAYRQMLRLGDEDLAVRVGGSASRALFEFYERQAEAQGSASTQALIEEDAHVEGHLPAGEPPLLGLTHTDPRIDTLLAAPLLVCTIDHLMPATEAQRAGRQIAPMLRLMSSDLVLDELDDFDIDDLPALTRLMHWAGLLGTRVLIASATLAPALVQGMFDAYRAGRQQFQRNRGEPTLSHPSVACLWVDEFGAQAATCADGEALQRTHAAFVARRVAALAQQPALRRGLLLPLPVATKKPANIRRDFAVLQRGTILQAHDAHATPHPVTGQPVSLGLVRMAHIEPLFDVALALLRLGAPAGLRIHLCVYHARFPLLLRSAKEQMLDAMLDRRDPSALYRHPEVAARLAAHPNDAHVFVVLSSPVCEVGRDHDYDWAIAEPSSMRSLIQLAGRVQRHRQQPPATPNVYVWDTNLRHLEHPGAPAFMHPGFESEDHRFTSHQLSDLLRDDEYAVLSARPRIWPRPAAEQQPQARLVDLEHARLAERMLAKERTPPPPPGGRRSRGTPRAAPLDAACAWQYPDAALTWALPQQQPFRRQTTPQDTLLLLPDDDAPDALGIYRIHDEPRHGRPAIYTREETRVQRLDLSAQFGAGIELWGPDDLPTLLAAIAAGEGLSLGQAAERFTPAQVLRSEQGWRYHPALGFARQA